LRGACGCLRMKKALLGLLAILLLAGGAAGVYFYLQRPAEAAIGDTEEHKAAKEDGHASKDDGHGGGSSSQYVELSPLVLPIINEDGLAQVLSIVVVIEVPNNKSAARVKEISPRLTDAYIQEMYGILNRHVALKGGIIQVSMLKERLNTISRRIIGDDMFNDVLLQVVQQRPI